MLTVWTQDRDTDQRVHAALPDDVPCRSCSGWEEFRTSLDDAVCAIVAARPNGAQFFADLQLLDDRGDGADGTSVALVLCLPRSSSGLRRLRDLTVDEVVWLDELEDQLARAVRRARSERRFRTFRHRVARCDHLSPTLANAIERALTRNPPVTSVQRLAHEVGRDRRTLWHHWNRTVDDTHELTLKAFLDWIVLLRAAVERTGSESWQEVAQEFGVHTRTLRRTARRRTKDRLGRLANGGLEECFRCFEEDVLPRLTRPGEAGGDGASGDQTPRA